jgi:hypothetical protein
VQAHPSTQGHGVDRGWSLNPIHPPAVIRPTEESPIAEGSIPQAIPGCTDRDRIGRRCYNRHPSDMTRWCDVCLDGHDPDGPLPSWMGGAGPRPTHEEESNPTPEEEAEILGHWLGRDGIAASPPDDWNPERREAFRRGYHRGRKEFEVGELEAFAMEQERQAEAFGDHTDQSEAVEALGAAAVRVEE